jgi:hypothetical protein
MPPTLETIEALLTDVNARLQALPTPLGDEQVRDLVNQVLTQAMADENHELNRRMRFGQRSPAQIQGSKFARFNLSVADIEFLHDLQVAAQAKGRSSGPSEELRNCYQAISEAVYMSADDVRRIDQRAIDNLFPRIPVAQFQGADRALAEKGLWWLTDAYKGAVQAMDSAESGYGSQLVGAQYVGELWEGARPDSRIFGLLNTFEMTDPTAYLPVEADLPEMLFVSENTSANASAYATVKTGSNRVSVSASKFVIHQQWSGEMEEDSIIPFVPFLRRQAALAIAHYTDSLVLNGDTTNAGTGNINLDDADPGDTKHYLAQDGIRHAALVDNTNNRADIAAAVTYGDLVTRPRAHMLDRTYLMDWGHPTRPEDLVYVADPETGDKIALLDEVVSVDKFGANATVLTGQLARIGMHPLITSIAMSKTEADGKVSTTGSNNTKGQVAVFNRRGLVAGWRRRIKLEVDRDIKADQNVLVYSLRLGLGRFSPTGAASGIEWASVLYDISL